jgi:para-nitrobenzyl esterase
MLRLHYASIARHLETARSHLFLISSIQKRTTQRGESMPFHTDLQIDTRSGPLRGVDDAHDTCAWRGIPFAAPPVGDLRWKAPRAVEPWSEPRDASRFGRMAPQAIRREDRDRTSEDCLYLNVWRPRTRETGLPVYFWIHGGGNTVALPAPARTPGCVVAHRSNMVFVSIHYRLGELGWFAHPALRSGKPGDALDDSGNYGTLDIVAALRWVQENIEAFGGDPRRVFVAGESAGAYNALCLLLSPAARGLFSGAMAQSGRQDTYSMDQADRRGAAVLRALLVDEGTAANEEQARVQLEKWSPEETAAYLRSRSFADLLRTRRRVPFFAGFRDGAVICREGFAALRAGTQPNKVPTIVGMNREEAKFQLVSSRAYERLDAQTYAALAKYLSDLKKATGADDVLRALATSPEPPPAVYGYLMSWGARDAYGRSAAPEPIASRVGACHGIDIPFFFGDFDSAPALGFIGAGFTEQNLPGRLALADAMLRYVAHFARTGNPNPPGSDLPEWKPWSKEPGAPKAIVFDADEQSARIAMTSEELREAAVRAALAQQPEELRKRVLEAAANER